MNVTTDSSNFFSTSQQYFKGHLKVQIRYSHVVTVNALSDEYLPDGSVCSAGLNRLLSCQFIALCCPSR